MKIIHTPNFQLSIFNYQLQNGTKTKNKSKRSLQHGIHDRRHIPAVDLLYGHLYGSHSECHQGNIAAGEEADGSQTAHAGYHRCQPELLRSIR